MVARQGLEIAYLNYGEQSGVTPQMTNALEARGHRVASLCVAGPLELRDSAGKRRLSTQFALHLAVSSLRFGRQAFAHRWNTTFAFDVHSRHAGSQIAALPRRPDVVLQNGALFAPGLPPSTDYVLLLDHTHQLSLEHTAAPGETAAQPIDYGPGWRSRETDTYRGARALATFSRRVAESLQRDYGVQGHRIHVVGAGANVFPETVERCDDGRTLLFVGKDFRRKGGDVLVRAFERVRQRHRDVRLVVVGPKETLSLPAGVVQLGTVSVERMANLFATSTIFVLPTLREPFGLAFLDAMACGLPCVGTTVEAVPEIIQHHETGLLVPPRDDEALAAALCSLLEDPSRAQAFGRAGRARVESRFRWSHAAERLEACLRAPQANAPEIAPVRDVA